MNSTAKKLFTVNLTLIMLLSLTACKKSEITPGTIFKRNGTFVGI